MRHGSQVERGANWVAEGVWDGPFSEGFAVAEHLFGSGAVWAGDSVTFSPSCALVDRLLWAETQGSIVVSNSLSVLLGATGWRLRTDGGAARTLYSIIRGIDAYDDEIPTDAGPVHQLFYHDLVVSPGRARVSEKRRRREIQSYAEYRALLTLAAERLGWNMTDSDRRVTVRSVATISRGYDSPAVCAVARAAGLRVCYTSSRSNSLVPPFLSSAATDDDGGILARALGLEAKAMMASRGDELAFLAGSDEPEFVFGSLAKEIEEAGVPTTVFTGYHGDMLWRVDAYEDEVRAPAIIRHDVSGLNLCEVRLKAGFFNVPLTFLFARSQASIGRISRSDEMRPWRSWSDYDRPIPRRLLVEAGVDGALFGQRKKAVVERPLLPADPVLRSDFLSTLQAETGYPRVTILASCILNSAMALPVAALRRCGVKAKSLARPADIRSRLYAWAVNRLADEYSTSLHEGRQH